MTITEFFNRHMACSEDLKWAVENCKDMDDVWQKAKPDLLIWVATREGVLTDQELKLFAVWCVRQLQPIMTDKRYIAVLDVSKRRVNGNATNDELKASWGAFSEAADMARDATWAAQAEYLRKNCEPNFNH